MKIGIILVKVSVFVIRLHQNLFLSVLDPFPTVYEPVPRAPVVGEPLSLPCPTPKCYPKGISYWGINRPYSNKLEAIENSDRVMLDYEGKDRFFVVLTLMYLVSFVN